MLTTYLSTLLQNLAWGKPKGGDIALLQITIAKLKKSLNITIFLKSFWPDTFLETKFLIV